MLFKMNNAMYQNSEVMARMTVATNTSTEAIARLTEKAQSDSRSVKILTFVAMLYLPATLVVVNTIRSPSLRSLGSTNQPGTDYFQFQSGKDGRERRRPPAQPFRGSSAVLAISRDHRGFIGCYCGCGKVLGRYQKKVVLVLAI